MTPKTDKNIIQKNMINLLKSMGYIFISKDENLNKKISTLLLEDILINQLQKLNSFNYKGKTYKFSSKNITNSIKSLDKSLNNNLIDANHKITEQLLLGNSYQEELYDGVKKSFSFKYIDFKNPENNIFHFTEKLNLLKELDIILFINGIPFAICELQDSNIETKQGISKLLKSQFKEEIVNLFKFTQILLAGNIHSPKVATISTPEKLWASWEENNNEILNTIIKNRSITKLDKTIYSLFEKNRVLELLSSFIIVDNKVKKIARYHQYFAIKNIIKKIDSTTKKKCGIIWHTKGSGKSLIILMLTRIIKKEIPNSKVIIITDKKDFKKQMNYTLNTNEIEVNIAKSGKELIKFIKTNKSIITTNINKFETIKKEKIILNDPNIFILVDESNKTKELDLNKALNKIFSSACYLCFTDSLLIKEEEKNNIEKFGGLLHKYTIDEAIKDNLILPVLYDKRLINHSISDKKRIEIIMLNINNHFIKNIQGTGFNAILATNSEYEAIKYHKLFKDLGDIKTAFLIAAPDNMDEYENIKNKFLNTQDIEILIIVNKFLTDFDTPRTNLLYIDKELNEHTLLQTINLVNKLYDGKDFGLIINYSELSKEKDLINMVIDIKDEILKVKTEYLNLEKLFKNIKNKNIQENYEVFLDDKTIRERFYKYLLNYLKALKLAFLSDKIYDIFNESEIEKYKLKMKFYFNLNINIKIRYHENIDFGHYEREIEKLINTFINKKNTYKFTKPINIFDKNFDIEIEKIIEDNAKADTILSAINFAITKKIDSNPSYYKKLSSKIKDVIETHKNYMISDEEKLNSAKNIRSLFLAIENQKNDNYPDSIKENRCARAIFDNIANEFHKTLMDRSTIIIEKISIQFDSIFKKVSKKPDWVSSNDIINQIDGDIEDILWDLEDEYNVKFKDLDEIILKIRNIGIHNYSN